MTENGCSSVMSMKDLTKQRKKKTPGDGVLKTGAAQQCLETVDMGRPIPAVSHGENSGLVVSGLGTLKGKKKKKNKKSKPLDIQKGASQSSKEGEGEDAAESIDSGCIADAPGDMGELTDWPQVEAVILEESKFVSSLLNWLPVPKADEKTEEEAVEFVTRTGDIKTTPRLTAKKSTSELEELQAKLRKDLETLQKSRKTKPWDVVSRRKETRLNKKLRNINKQFERRARQSNLLTDNFVGGDTMSVKTSSKNNTVKPGTSKPQKPIYNKYGELVFSKFDFSENSQDANDDPKPKDLKQMLSKALKEKEKAKQLEQKGLKDAAVDMVEKRAWTSALQKAEGVKVRDDVEMLKHSIKKKEARKKASQKKWEMRMKAVEQKKLDREAARAKNLGARKDAKLKKKMGKMKKKGHIVPGF